MPCKTCDTNRVIVDGVPICPLCSKIEISNQSYLANLQGKIKNNFAILDLLLKNCDFSYYLGLAAGLREEAARHLIENPYDAGHAEVWAACSLLIKRLRPHRGEIDVTIGELLEVCNELVESCNERSAIMKGMRVAAKNGVIPTEREPLGHASKSVVENLLNELGKESRDLNEEFFKDFPGELEALAFEGEMIVARNLILSEAISRAFETTLHERLLPDLNGGEKSTSFIEIAERTASIIALILGRDFDRRSGLIALNNDQFQFVRKILESQTTSSINDLLFGKKSNSGSDLTELGYTLLPEDSLNGYHLLGYHSLILIATAAYKHSKDPNRGRAANFKGGIIEQYIYGVVTGILDTNLLETGEKLFCYPLPDPYGDIDIGGYSTTTFVIIESKFWNTPNLPSLEKELQKFERRIEYLRLNPVSEGLKNLEILPIFYTPYAPFAKFNNITLVSSVLGLTLLLTTKFGVKSFDLIQGNEKLSHYLREDKGERIFPLDVSEVLSEFPPNLFRINDGVFGSIDEKEANVSVMLPSYSIVPIALDMNDSVKNRMISENLKTGTVIRMLLFNVTGGWGLTQLVDYVLLKTPDEVKGLELEAALRLASPNVSLEDYVMRTWGENEGKLLMNFAAKWNIDLNLFFDKIRRTGKNLYTAIASAEVLESPHRSVLQCDCGEIFSIPTSTIKPLRRKYSDSRLRCRSCDSDLVQKLEEISHTKLYPISFSDFIDLSVELEKFGLRKSGNLQANNKHEEEM